MKKRTPYEQKIYDAAYKAAYDKYQELRSMKGGEGSGNFGHTGRPGEVCGSGEGGGSASGGGTSGECGGTFYHGTTSEAAEYIKKNGLEISKASRNSKKGKVYITSSKDNAAYWAEDKLDFFGLDKSTTDLVIFEIKIPAGVAIDRDTQSSSENDFVHTGNIPAEWIVGETTISIKSAGKYFVPVLFSNGKMYI